VCCADERTANYCVMLVTTIRNIRRESKKKHEEIQPSVYPRKEEGSKIKIVIIIINKKRLVILICAWSKDQP
jgi:hypothetical protein